jgi:hypothetical protein
MLSPYRVLDLCDERGLLCGQILADLGADVIAVEPREGSRARRAGPFQNGVAGPERSLQWQAHARNRRGVALDLDDASDRRAFLGLVEGADFLLESDAPGALAARGLGYADLAARNPGLVYVSISPFGQDGPRAGWAATDLIVQAACGSLVLSGEPDRAPQRTGGVSAFAYAGAEAAGAALVAHFERVRSGRGQHVDVSAQLSANLAAFTLLSSRIGAPRASRSGRRVDRPAAHSVHLAGGRRFPCSLLRPAECAVPAPPVRLVSSGAIDEARDRDRVPAWCCGAVTARSVRRPARRSATSCARSKRELSRAPSSVAAAAPVATLTTLESAQLTARLRRDTRADASVRHPGPSRASRSGPSRIVFRRRVSASTAPSSRRDGAHCLGGPRRRRQCAARGPADPRLHVGDGCPDHARAR